MRLNLSLLTDWQQNSLRHNQKGRNKKFLPLKFILFCVTMTTVRGRKSARFAKWFFGIVCTTVLPTVLNLPLTYHSFVVSYNDL